MGINPRALPAHLKRQIPGHDDRPKPKRRPAQNGKLPRQSEASFMAQVVAYAEMRGWHCWHDQATNAPRRCSACGEIRSLPRNAAGFPDLVLVRRPHIVWAELKRDGEQPTPDQRAWLDELRACGQQVYVWRPSQWSEVERVLR